MTKTTQGMWTEFKRRLIAWQDRGFETRNMSDRTLRDIGLSRAGKFGSAESFWMT
jgi:uncharacterized protein YjiS (DUF1127 family)